MQRGGEPGRPAAPASRAGIRITPVELNCDWHGDAGFGSGVPGFCTDMSPAGPAVVHLQGAVTQTSSLGPGADAIGTLPETFRPSRNVFAIVHSFTGTYVDPFISALTGQIIVIGARSPAVADGRLVSREGITFTDNVSLPITINTADYSASTVFNTFVPSAVRAAEYVGAPSVYPISGTVAVRSCGQEPSGLGGLGWSVSRSLLASPYSRPRCSPWRSAWSAARPRWAATGPRWRHDGDCGAPA